MIASACAALADGLGNTFSLTAYSADGEPVPAGWQVCLEHLRAIESALGVLQQGSGVDRAGVIPSAKA